MTFLRGMRWWEFVPEGALALGLGFFFVTETSAARSAFKSSTALALMAGAAVVWVATRLALSRAGRFAGLRTVAFAAAAAGVLAVVVLPAYDDETVVETLPVAAQVMTPTTDATPMNDVTPTSVVTPPSVATPTTVVTPTTVAQPRPIGAGAISGIDHRASGNVKVYAQPDGRLVVGLEDIDIQPGPDYDVFVVPGRDAKKIEGGVRLDDLRGNKGTQYYEVPASAGFVTGEWTVLVWCQTFDVPVAHATPV